MNIEIMRYDASLKYLGRQISFEKPQKDQNFMINGTYVTCREALMNIPNNAPNQEPTKHHEQVLRRLKKTDEGKDLTKN